MIPVVWSEEEARHDPRAEIWVGVRTPAAEVPARADAIRAALGGGRPSGAARAPAARRRAAHRPRRRRCVGFLRTAWDAWEAAGLPQDPGQDRVVPYIFPHPGLTAAPGEPAATWARTGMYCFDTMTLIGPARGRRRAARPTRR